MLGFIGSVLFSAAAVAVLTASPAAAAVEVTQCGASVPAGATGFLSANLDCSSGTGDGVLLNNGATLMLGGFELIGNPSALSGTGVRCTDNCSVTGPGTVRAFPWDGVFSPSGHVVIRDATIQDLGRHGVFANFISIFDSTIAAASEWAVYASSTASVSGSSIMNSDVGVIADSRDTLEEFRGTVSILDSTVSGNGTGVFAYLQASITNSSLDGNSNSGVHSKTIRMKNSSASNNGSGGVVSSGLGRPNVSVVDSVVSGNGYDGIQAIAADGQTGKAFGKLSVLNAEVRNNDGHGIYAYSAKIGEGSVISENSEHGVVAVRARADSSTVSANGADGLRLFHAGKVASRLSMTSVAVTVNGFDGVNAEGKITIRDSTVTGNGGVDIRSASWVRPTVSTTTCETSYSSLNNTDWDICSLDPM